GRSRAMTGTSWRAHGRSGASSSRLCGRAYRSSKPAKVGPSSRTASSTLGLVNRRRASPALALIWSALGRVIMASSTRVLVPAAETDGRSQEAFSPVGLAAVMRTPRARVLSSSLRLDVTWCLPIRDLIARATPIGALLFGAHDEKKRPRSPLGDT